MRVNIEEKAWTDPRIIDLAVKLKLKHWAAIGAMSAIWRHCQATNSAKISRNEITHLIGMRGFVEAALEVGLLANFESSDRAFYVSGIQDRLDELAAFKSKRSESGKLGANKRWQVPCHSHSDAIGPQWQADGKQMASMSLSMSSSMSLSKNQIHEEKELKDIGGGSSEPPPPSPAADAEGVLVDAEIVSNDPLPISQKPKTPRKKPVLQYTEDDWELAGEWLAWSLAGLPTLKASQESFSVAIFNVRRGVSYPDKGHLTHDGLRALFRFVQNDPFWAKNCLSPAGLLSKGKNGLRKIDNILAAMKRQDNGGREADQFFKSVADGTFEPTKPKPGFDIWGLPLQQKQ